MPLYSYQGVNLNGHGVSGQLQAHDPKVLHATLYQQGIILKKYSGIDNKFSLSGRRQISSSDLQLLLQEFISLTSAGFSIPSVLRMLSDRPDQPVMQSILQGMLTDIEQGETLAAAAAKHTNLFDNYLLASLRIGERIGNLVDPLKRYLAFLRTKIALSKKIQQAMAYPAFLLVTLVLALAVLFLFVLPRFSEMYAGFNAQLPRPTLILLSIVENIHIIAGVLLLCLLAGYSIYKVAMKSYRYRVMKDALVLKFPLYGKLLRTFYIAQITRILATLLGSSVNVVEAIKNTAEGIDNLALREQLLRAAEQVTEGRPMSDAFLAVTIIPKKSLNLIRAGEESGRIEELLLNLSEFYQEMLDYQVGRIVAIIEPLLMLIIGLLIGGIILVMYLPIFSIADIIQ